MATSMTFIPILATRRYLEIKGPKEKKKKIGKRKMKSDRNGETHGDMGPSNPNGKETKKINGNPRGTHTTTGDHNTT